MLSLISNYPRSFIAALIFHVIVAFVFVVNFEFSSKVIHQPEVDVVQATAINEEQVLAELAALKAREAKKRKSEQNRLKKLNKEADRAKKKRLKEQRRLKELEKKRKKALARKRKLDKERKISEKRKDEADRKRKIAEKKQKVADKNRRVAEEASKMAQQRRVIELEKQRLAEQSRKKAEDERRRAEIIERKAKEKALRAIEEQQRIEDARVRQRELAAEEKRLSASHSKKAQKIVRQYIRIIKKQIENKWNKGKSKEGSHCDVFVRLMPTGDVLQVEARNCVGGKIFKRSVEDAVRAAAPLHLPTDKSLFSQFREIMFRFDPR